MRKRPRIERDSPDRSRRSGIDQRIVLAVDRRRAADNRALLCPGHLPLPAGVTIDFEDTAGIGDQGRLVGETDCPRIAVQSQHSAACDRRREIERASAGRVGQLLVHLCVIGRLIGRRRPALLSEDIGDLLAEPDTYRRVVRGGVGIDRHQERMTRRSRCRAGDVLHRKEDIISDQGRRRLRLAEQDIVIDDRRVAAAQMIGLRGRCRTGGRSRATGGIQGCARVP